MWQDTKAGDKWTTSRHERFLTLHAGSRDQFSVHVASECFYIIFNHMNQRPRKRGFLTISNRARCKHTTLFSFSTITSVCLQYFTYLEEKTILWLSDYWFLQQFSLKSYQNACLFPVFNKLELPCKAKCHVNVQGSLNTAQRIISKLKCPVLLLLNEGSIFDMKNGASNFRKMMEP